MDDSQLMQGQSRLVSAIQRKRPKPAADVWDWQDFASWRDVIWEITADLLDEKVKAAFVQEPPEYVVSDDLTWLDDIVWSIHEGGWDNDIKELVTERIQQRYRAIRVVHGTRTSDVSPFYRDGLLPLDPQWAHERARQIFLRGRFPEITAENLEKAIQDVGTQTREGCVYFEGNERELIRHCGHYMLYGSEYLVAIAAHIPGGWRDYRQVLKEEGQPTLFICDVPLGLIHPGTLREFTGTALEYIFEELLEPESYEPDPHRGAGFPIRCVLPPDYIVGHYHPVVRYDPLR